MLFPEPLLARNVNAVWRQGRGIHNQAAKGLQQCGRGLASDGNVAATDDIAGSGIGSWVDANLSNLLSNN